MTSPAAAHRLLLVHAHPDDETIGTGATMAKYVDAGAHVALVTCTLGEEGEILLDEHAHRAADRDDSLGEHRKIELANAMAALGVTDHRQLGGDHRYRDSGMMGTPDNDDPACFWRADLLAHKPLIGCWCSLANASTAEVLGLAGFDWLLVDGEHAPNDVTSLVPQLMALK